MRPEELQNRLWPNTFVDVERDLNTAINKIREVLGDSAENPSFVETLPRRGYRFIGELEAPVHPVVPATDAAAVSKPMIASGPRWGRVGVALGITAVVVAGAWYMQNEVDNLPLLGVECLHL